MHMHEGKHSHNWFIILAVSSKVYVIYICQRNILSEHYDMTDAVPDKSCQCELHFKVVKLFH
jgi:hypothetical protein